MVDSPELNCHFRKCLRGPVLLFPTISFATFFILVFAASWALKSRAEARKWLLLVASYIFYGWWDWRFCFLLFGASMVAWFAGLLLERTSRINTRKTIVGFAVASMLVVLGVFKYYGFFLSGLQDVLFALGWQRDLPFLEIILPVGISFFTFQAISYVIDVYREDVTARRSPLDVLLYISLFPQLVAGPIVRAADFLPQLERRAVLTRNATSFGLVLIIVGLFKKMVVANYLASELVDPVFLDPASQTSALLLAGVYGYAVQIYCDFSGYSDIAIGTAALLGFHFKENFNQPYRASSLQDFWRRWHISLSGWLRDYLFIPLGGSRNGTFKTYRNLFLTMFLGGLWHGAAWNFVIWGSLHGAWLAGERALSRNHKKTAAKAILGWLITFHVVCAAWVFFRAQDLQTALDWFVGLTAFTGSVAGLTWFSVFLITATMVFQLTPRDGVQRISTRLANWPVSCLAIVFALALLATLWLAPAGTAPFIYFQF